MVAVILLLDARGAETLKGDAYIAMFMAGN